ncbi:hypothetical protein DPMN_161821 [Dreissena polymorpha]|uniref:Uncharacterized protein n=1 Tax=Dreissena polymorpha TaxID=45954 RepID=A0A9D4EQB4_DREPO|nr:hypothetical protein DPMN_161821 [Dreissena polymorpha]
MKVNNFRLLSIDRLRSLQGGLQSLLVLFARGGIVAAGRRIFIARGNTVYSMGSKILARGGKEDRSVWRSIISLQREVQSQLMGFLLGREQYLLGGEKIFSDIRSISSESLLRKKFSARDVRIHSIGFRKINTRKLLKNAQDTLNEMKQVADESMKMKVFVENFYQKHAALEDEDYEQAVKGNSK